jgi:hypothetical protein
MDSKGMPPLGFGWLRVHLCRIIRRHRSWPPWVAYFCQIPAQELTRGFPANYSEVRLFPLRSQETLRIQPVHPLLGCPYFQEIRPRAADTAVEQAVRPTRTRQLRIGVMNMVGKIFVFLNLFLAVAFMAMSMMVYATHRNMRTEIEDPKTGWKVQYINKYKEAESLAKQRRELEVQLNAEVIARERALAAAESHRQALVAQLQQAKETLVQKEKSLAAATEANTALQLSLKTHADAEAQVAEAAKLAAKENDERFKRLIALTNELNVAMSQIPIYKERQAQLAEQVAKAKVLLQKLGHTIEDAPSLQPPPVTGTVLAVGRLQDPNLIELSLGSYDGLRNNHTVDLYRGNVYLGRAVITNTEGDRAVAKVLRDGLRAAVKEDDSFTTRLQYMTSQINANNK